MPLHFTPKKEEELSRFSNLPDGEYPFTVMESGEQASKSAKNAGKIMVKVKLCVHGPDMDKHVYDYFADWFSEWKLKHFCETIGIGMDYESGNVDATGNAYQDRTGFVRIKTETDASGTDRNVVDDYIVQLPESAPKKITKEEAAKKLEPAKAAAKAAAQPPVETDDFPI